MFPTSEYETNAFLHRARFIFNQVTRSINNKEAQMFGSMASFKAAASQLATPGDSSAVSWLLIGLFIHNVVAHNVWVEHEKTFPPFLWS